MLRQKITRIQNLSISEKFTSRLLISLPSWFIDLPQILGLVERFKLDAVPC
jgi:hypothetical protein